jgi:hypothetical protein
VGAFDGGVISSDGGALLLGATDEAIGLVDRFAACFRDGRAAELIEHSIETLVRQRVVGVVLGYEDLSSYPLQELFALAHERLTRLLPQAHLRPAAA